MPSLFRDADTLLKLYAEYHRDRRNIATHLVGVPMIVLGLLVLLSRPEFGSVAALPLTPAAVVWALGAAWYLTRGRFGLGLATSAVMLAMLPAAHALAGDGTSVWLGAGLGLFVVGWIVQFVGHYYEGRKPAFADDLVGLLVGPMFVMLEVLVALGLCRELATAIERHAGPTHLRDLHPTA